jgi:serine/threonine protein kinase
VRTNAEWLRRFRREGQAARRFRHPNAVTVYDLRTAADGTIYMVMEYVEGHTLDHEIKTRGRFSAAEAFEILSPIMSVLDTAHSMGVVHRDLKPENIMIGKSADGGQSNVKLLDLGIAKMREIAGDNGGNTALTMADRYSARLTTCRPNSGVRFRSTAAVRLTAVRTSTVSDSCSTK